MLGWSKWHEWGHCTAHCNKGIQQRHRYCTKNQMYASSDVDKMEKSETNKNWGKTKNFENDEKSSDYIHSCDGYNIEQRDCNLFKCKGKKEFFTD